LHISKINEYYGAPMLQMQSTQWLNNYGLTVAHLHIISEN